mmetsp:Transcript_44535/g.141891  ORF Transcript_44535/g.141891 Transcript_44535/m.141891 type:complete len:245 (-) Transcript_44535:15-749(-)
MILGNPVESHCAVLHQVVVGGVQELLPGARGGERLLLELLLEEGFVNVTVGGRLRHRLRGEAAAPHLRSGGDGVLAAALHAERGIRHKKLLILEHHILPMPLRGLQHCMLGPLAVVGRRQQRPCALTLTALPVCVLVHLHHELLERAHRRVEAMSCEGPLQVAVVGDALLAAGVVPEVGQSRLRGEGFGDEGVLGAELRDERRRCDKRKHRLRHRGRDSASERCGCTLRSTSCETSGWRKNGSG